MIKKRYLMIITTVVVSVLLGSLLYNNIVLSKEEEKGRKKLLGFINAPAYDSEWLSIEPAETLTLRHNLNTTEVFVYLIGKSDLYDVHQTNYGCNEVEGQGWRGIAWYGLNATCIKIMRCRYDTNAQVQWNYIRVMIWKIQEPPA